MQKTYTIDSSEYGKIPGLKITQEWNGFFLMENSECSLVVKGDIDQINGINPVNVWRVK